MCSRKYLRFYNGLLRFHLHVRYYLLCIPNGIVFDLIIKIFLLFKTTTHYQSAYFKVNKREEISVSKERSVILLQS